MKNIFLISFIFYLFPLFGQNDVIFDNFPNGVELRSFTLGDGFTFGHNIYKEKEFAEKYILTDSVLLKGIATQNKGVCHSDDSAMFSVYQNNLLDLPGDLIFSKKIPYKCLRLDGNLNIISFDTVIKIPPKFFVAFGLADYHSNPWLDTLCVMNSYANTRPFSDTINHNRNVVRWFNNNWYDIYTVNTYYDEATETRQGYRLNLAIYPIINYNFNNLAAITNDLLCINNVSDNLKNKNNTCSIYPNPTSDLLSLSINLEKKSNVNVKLYNISGKLLHCWNFYNESKGNITKIIDISNFEKGLYFIKVNCLNEYFNLKVIKI